MPTAEVVLGITKKVLALWSKEPHHVRKCSEMQSEYSRVNQFNCARLDTVSLRWSHFVHLFSGATCFASVYLAFVGCFRSSACAVLVPVRCAQEYAAAHALLEPVQANMPTNYSFTSRAQKVSWPANYQLRS
jgi:hypothetical protein